MNQVPVLSHISDMRAILYTEYIHMYACTRITHAHTHTIHIHGLISIYIVCTFLWQFRVSGISGPSKWLGEQTGTLSGCTLATAVAAAALLDRSLVRFSVRSIGSRVACFVWRLPESTRNVFTACITYFPNNNHRPQGDLGQMKASACLVPRLYTCIDAEPGGAMDRTGNPFLYSKFFLLFSLWQDLVSIRSSQFLI